MNVVQLNRRPGNLRRPVLNELSRSSSEQSDDFILVEDNEFMNNSRNINNQSQLSSRSIPEEEIIKTRGRKKTKCSPFLRDLSPNTLATIKSPIKNSRNEDLLRFLRSPTPRKCKLKIEDNSPPLEIKRARKSLIIDLDLNTSLIGKNPSTTSTPTSAKKKSANKKLSNSNKKRKSLNTLKRSTNIKT